MKQITHYQKVMWGLYLEYSHIKIEVKYTRTFCCVDNCYRMMRSTRRSKEEWDFISSKYYYITDIDPIFSGSKEDFISHLERRGWRGGMLSSPDAFKVKSYGNHWNRNGRNSSFKKKPHIKKNELSIEEINKRAWREKKKDPKHKSHWNRNCAIKDFKQEYNRERRRRIKREIQKRTHSSYELTWWDRREDNYTPLYQEGCHSIVSDWDDYTHEKKNEVLDFWHYD